MRSILLVPLMLWLLAGCSTAAKHSFEVEVTNATGQTLSAGLVKHAPVGLTGGARPAMEDGWAAPEDVAISAPALGDRHWGELIAPGKTVVLGPRTGRFSGPVTAALRVYVGNHTVDELLGYTRDDPDRLDVALWPGRSQYVISYAKGRLSVERK